MYKILAFKNGQPIILYIENEKVYMYTAARGKIIPKGLLFNDVGRDFDVFSCDKQYVYYISTDNKMKLAVLNRDRFTEFLSIPLGDSSHQMEIVNISPLMCQNELYIFYCNHNKSNNKYEIYYILSSCPEKSCLIKRNVSTNKGFDVFKANEKIGIVLNDSYYYLSTEKKLVSTNTSHKDKEKINTLTENINYLKSVISEKSNCLIDVQNLLSEKENEIQNLEETQENIVKQYNELAEYAGKLQDELRKFRYM